MKYSNVMVLQLKYVGVQIEVILLLNFSKVILEYMFKIVFGHF